MEEFIEMLQKAIGLEKDGYEYYIRSARKAKNHLTKSLFSHLAKEENVHYRKIKAIASSLQNGKRILKKDILPIKGGGSIMREIFAGDYKVKTCKEEIEALKIAEKMEKGSIRHYKDALRKARDPIVKEFILNLIKEEEGHLISIEDSIEFITSPEDWFARQERNIYDGA